MPKTIQVFISYKKVEDGDIHRTPQIAIDLAARLHEHKYEVFIDEEKIDFGSNWQNKIYDSIHSSDVLIVLLHRETAKSDWVQREVDVARGAYLSILPLQIDAEVDVADTVKRLALGDIQHFPRFTGSEVDYKKLFKSIDSLARETRTRQRQWFNNLEAKWRAECAATNKHFATYVLSDFPEAAKVHLATGDITDMTGIDVIVSSENDYMQMARVFERRTLSSALRREGALMNYGRLVEDTVQEALDAHIAGLPGYHGRPVQMMEVIPTRAGHPQSTLVDQNGIRYIFHAATVRVEEISKHERLVPIEDDASIKKVVRRCLKTVGDIDKKKGLLPLEKPSDEPDPEPYTPIKSIIFPIFGTGHGGRPVEEVVRPMIAAIKDFLSSELNKTALEHIYLSIYSEADIEVVKDTMVNHAFTEMPKKGRSG